MKNNKPSSLPAFSCLDLHWPAGRLLTGRPLDKPIPIRLAIVPMRDPAPWQLINFKRSHLLNHSNFFDNFRKRETSSLPILLLKSTAVKWCLIGLDSMRSVMDEHVAEQQCAYACSTDTSLEKNLRQHKFPATMINLELPQFVSAETCVLVLVDFHTLSSLLSSCLCSCLLPMWCQRVEVWKSRNSLPPWPGPVCEHQRSTSDYGRRMLADRNGNHLWPTKTRRVNFERVTEPEGFGRHALPCWGSSFD